MPHLQETWFSQDISGIQYIILSVLMNMHLISISVLTLGALSLSDKSVLILLSVHKTVMIVTNVWNMLDCFPLLKTFHAHGHNRVGHI